MRTKHSREQASTRFVKETGLNESETGSSSAHRCRIQRDGSSPRTRWPRTFRELETSTNWNCSRFVEQNGAYLIDVHETWLAGE